MKISYKDIRFKTQSLEIIDTANSIISEYLNQGFDLTLRQLYYQFVAQDLLPYSWADTRTGSTNNEKSYKKLGEIINNARLAGLISWRAIQDRTRVVRSNTHWRNPAHIIEAAKNSYYLNKWSNQELMAEVWIEKDALVGIIEDVCYEYDVPFFSCRGYTSQSAMWRASQRIRGYKRATIIYYLGDHDPSGIDMGRDIDERLTLFEAPAVVNRIALTMEQIEDQNPPANPTKVTDSRAKGYMSKYGNESWELDALEPNFIVDLISSNIENIRDKASYKKIVKQEEKDKEQLNFILEGLDE